MDPTEIENEREKLDLSKYPKYMDFGDGIKREIHVNPYFEKFPEFI